MSETKIQKAQRMADLIVERVKATGECTDNDLRQVGFTDKDIEQCKSLAQGFAATQMPNRNLN